MALTLTGSVAKRGFNTDASCTVMSNTTPPPGTGASRHPRRLSGSRTA